LPLSSDSSILGTFFPLGALTGGVRPPVASNSVRISSPNYRRPEDVLSM
jgi:hypothetical protein